MPSVLYVTDLVDFHEVVDCEDIPIHGLVFPQGGLHLGQPVQQGLQGLWELTRKQ